MQRNVYFDGELAEKYGEKVSVHAKSVQDVVKLLEANDPTFKNYVLSCAEKGVGFSVEVEGDYVEKEEDLILPLKKGDVFISAVPAGSKSGGAKIFAAIAIGALFLMPGGALATAAAKSSAAAAAGTTVSTSIAAKAFAYKMLSGLAINLAITGIQQLMAPDPSTDEGPESYLFNADNQNIEEGDPMPLAYGRLRVPGRAIGFSVMNENTYDMYRFESQNYINSFSGAGDPQIDSVPTSTPAGAGTGTTTLFTDPLGNIRNFPTPKVIGE